MIVKLPALTFCHASPNFKRGPTVNTGLLSESHGILDQAMIGKLAEIRSQEGSHVMRRRIDLAGAWPFESSPFLTRSANRPSHRAVPLHGAATAVQSMSSPADRSAAGALKSRTGR